MNSLIASLTPGRTVDNWKIVRSLGAGAYGAVFEATDLNEPAKKFAFKASTDSFQMEIEALEIFKEKNAKRLLQYVAHGHTVDFHYIVMSLTGPSLDIISSKLTDNKFSFRTIAHIANESLKGLQELHSFGYVHSDIKPSNIALCLDTTDPTLCLVDFGMARKYITTTGFHVPKASAITSFRGTIRYASITALRMDQGNSRSNDMWSWLYSLIEMATGKLPWDHDDSATSANVNITVKYAWCLN